MQSCKTYSSQYGQCCTGFQGIIIIRCGQVILSVGSLVAIGMAFYLCLAILVFSTFLWSCLEYLYPIATHFRPLFCDI